MRGSLYSKRRAKVREAITLLTALFRRLLGLKGRPERGSYKSGGRLHLLFPSFSKPVSCPSAPALTSLVGEGGTKARGLLGHPLLQRLLAQAKVAQGGHREAPLLAPRFPIARQDHSWGRSRLVGVARVRPGPALCPQPALAGPRVLHAPPRSHSPAPSGVGLAPSSSHTNLTAQAPPTLTPLSRSSSACLPCPPTLPS